MTVNLLKCEPTKISAGKKRLRVVLNDGFRDGCLDDEAGFLARIDRLAVP